MRHVPTWAGRLALVTHGAAACGLTVTTALGASPSPVPCIQSIKFAGLQYVDTGIGVPASEIDGAAGPTDPNSAHCGLGPGLTVYRHRGHLSTDEVVYREPGGKQELFRSLGAPGFPFQGLVRGLVVALVVLIVVFAVLPAIIGHLRNPPIVVDSAEPEPPSP